MEIITDGKEDTWDAPLRLYHYVGTMTYLAKKSHGDSLSEINPVRTHAHCPAERRTDGLHMKRRYS